MANISLKFKLALPHYIIIIMIKCFLSFITAMLLVLATRAQSSNIISGPVLGQITYRTATILLEVSPTVQSVSLQYWKKSEGIKAAKTVVYKGLLGNSFNPLKIDIGELDMNTAYEYQCIVDKKIVPKTKAAFTTLELWQWRKPAPDFSFITGSCAYFNQPIYDRPGKPYGGDSSIFETIAKEKAAFMLWLGDNWYTREVDYYSAWGLNYRASHDRSLPILQPLWRAMPHYAIWDDHDYGPNNANKAYILKEDSRKVFMQYWGNPSFGEEGKGIYTKISYGDVDIFLMDDRYFRSSDDMNAFIHGKPNPIKRMWGEQQMEWLKNALLFSNATFKIIATGSQTLNKASKDDCLQSYPIEFNELMDFFTTEKINGILFLTGDRHHSEVVEYKRDSAYTLYDITNSPFTSGIGVLKERDKEFNNPDRIPNTLVEKQNYSRISIHGKKGERVLTVEFIDVKGNKLADWKVSEKELKFL